MNAPEQPPTAKRYIITVDVHDNRFANVVSFESATDSLKTSSISSGALADHSSLSESSENGLPLPHTSSVPRISHGSHVEDHSTSTSSSGLSGPAAGGPVFARPQAACLCCSVLQFLKIRCTCGKRNIFYVRDDPTPRGEAAEAGRLPEVVCSSDMDLTDPVIYDRTSSTDIVTPPVPVAEQSESANSVNPEPPKTSPLQSEPEEVVEGLPRAEPVEIPIEECRGGSQLRTSWKLPSVETVFCFPEELPTNQRPPQIPSNYKEDDSLFYHMIWSIQTLQAFLNYGAPPQGVVRVFYNENLPRPDWPTSVAEKISGISDELLEKAMADFKKCRERALKNIRFSKESRETDFVIVVSDDETEETTPEKLYEFPESLKRRADKRKQDPSEPETPSKTARMAEEPLMPSRNEDTVNEELETGGIGQGGPLPDHGTVKKDGIRRKETNHESARVVPETRKRRAGEDATAQSARLIFARLDQWYYPGVVECTLEQWEKGTEPLKVLFYDGQGMMLPPDKIFLFERLPSGAQIQRESGEAEYVDTVYLSHIKSRYSSRLPSAILTLDDEMNRIRFDKTALSPKDVIRLRATLKHKFLPTRAQINFTQISSEDILQTKRTRRQQADLSAPTKPGQTKKDVPPTARAKVDAQAEVPSKESKVVHVPQKPTKAPVPPSEVKIEKPYGCYVPGCTKAYTDPSNVSRHVKKVHGAEYLRNPASGNGQTKSAAPSTRSASPADPNKPHKCDVPVCNKAYAGLSQLRRHIKQIHGVEILENFDRKMRTNRQAVDSKLFKCGVPGCERTYAEPRSVRRHIKQVHGDKFLPKNQEMIGCPEKGCTKNFDTKQHLERHLNDVHSKPQMIRCPEEGCLKKFATKQHLEHHLNEVHSKRQVPSEGKRVSSEKISTVGKSPNRPTLSSNFPFASPSTSGMAAQHQTSGSDTDTAQSPASGWNQYVRGNGLSLERLKLDESVKSFTGLKGQKRTEAMAEVFKGQHFVLTSETTERKQASVQSRKKLQDSESDSTDIENYYNTPVEFNVSAIQRAIEYGGGHVYANLMDVPKELRENAGCYSVILVSDHPCRTPNYVYGVVLGLTIVRHDTILECSRAGIPLRSALKSGTATLLPPGWDDLRKTWVSPRASKVLPLEGLLIFIALTCSSDGRQFWSSVIRHLGGRPLEWIHSRLCFDSQVHTIVVDENLDEDKKEATRTNHVPLVTTRWLIQAAISGKTPPLNCDLYTIHF